MLTELTGHRGGIHVHVVEGVLDGDQTGDQLVSGEDGGTPDPTSEGSGTHPQVVLKGVLVRNFTPQTHLRSQDAAFVDVGREDDEVLIDCPPDAVDALCSIEPEVALSLVEVEDVRGREDDLAGGSSSDYIGKRLLLATSVWAPQ